ncbi:MULTISPECIES: phospholipase A2 [Streptomyces]|uniref:phospholipase A2 n=1 Tax=Streptomyces TaxID=1883 RepID=UPI001135A157|nr:phospholipase A2 [Streptomyces sp. S816]TGZ16022.1 hypothetical protein DV517_09950 [Streptomyces sp. S816]
MRKFVITAALGAALTGLLAAGPAQAADSTGDASTGAAASASVSDPNLIVVKEASAPHMYTFDTILPSGGKLVPVQGSDGGNTGEVLVTGPKGEFLGSYDAPWALDAANHPVPVSYRISGSTLVEEMNFAADTKFPVTTGRPAYSEATDGTGAPDDDTSSDPSGASGISGVTSKKVTIPGNYVYNPKLGTLHDYCTSSPDKYGSADFRGPCARHDLCYAKKGNHKKTCDAQLLVDLTANCRYAYGSWNPMRFTCISTAGVYYGAVTAYGDDN